MQKYHKLISNADKDLVVKISKMILYGKVQVLRCSDGR